MNFNQIKYGKPSIYVDGINNIDPESITIYNRIIADGGVSDLTRLNYFVVGLKTIYGSLANVPVCYDAHWIGYKLGSGTGATAGQAAAKLYSLQGNIQGDAPNKYWVGSGVNGNFMSTPSAAANQITGDIEIIAKIQMQSYSVVGAQSIVAKGNISTGVGNSYALIYSTSTLDLVLGVGGSISDNNSTALLSSVFTANQIGWVKATRVGSTITFYTSNDGVTYSQLGTTLTRSGSLNTVGILEIGSANTGASAPFQGKIYQATISNSIGGTPVVEFNPNLYTGANTWASATSEVWTINSTGAGLADAVQTTAASQPLLLAHNGVDNYWYSPQINGNFCSAPSITIPTASGFELDVKVSFTANDDTTNTSGWFVSHDTGGSPNRNIFFGFSGSRTLILYLNNLSLSATASTQFPAAFNGWLRVNATTVSANMEVKYFTSTDGITFTQLGTTITLVGGANCIKTTAIKLDVTGNNGANTTAGKYFRAILKDANGVTRSDFNPATYNAATSQTQWTSTTGEVWTINTGTATTGYKGVLVDRTIVQGDGVDDFISVTGLTSRQYFTRYVACIPYTNPNTAPRIISGNADTHLIFKTGAGAFEAYNGLQLAFTGELVNILQALIVDYNSTNSKTFVNNAGETSGSTGTTSSTAVSLFGSVTGTTLSNAVINTVIQPISVDNATTRTATYNFLKTLNNL